MSSVGVRRVDLGDAATVAIGEVFEVSIPTAHSAGLRLDVDVPDAIALISEDGEPGRRFGGKGRAVYRFQCRRRGDFSIAFRQVRPWSGEGQTATLCIHCGD